MRKLVQLIARVPVAAAVVASAFLLVTPATAQDMPSKAPAKKAPAGKTAAKKAPAGKTEAKRAPAGKTAATKAAPVEKKVPVVPVPAEAPAFAEPPAMVPSELEEPEMSGAPESLEHENTRNEPAPAVDPFRVQGVRRARLGAVVEPADIPEALAALGVASGIRVKELIEGTPAHLDGMLVGDVITRVEGKPIARATDAVNALAGHKPGEVAIVQVIRDGKPILLRLKLDQGTKVIKPSALPKARRKLRQQRHRFRMNMRQWRRDLRRRHQLRMRQLYRRRY